MEVNHDIVAQVSELARLRAEGALTDEEFKELKSKLLSRKIEPDINSFIGAEPESEPVSPTDVQPASAAIEAQSTTWEAVRSIFLPLLMIGGTIMAVVIIVGLASQPESESAANKSASPLRCAVEQAVISCSVIASTVRVTDAKINRGNCALLEKTPGLGQGLDLFFGNFRSTHKFGDSFLIPAGCTNIIEATIFTDKGNWTWKFQ